jgi:hypothetical protein
LISEDEISFKFLSQIILELLRMMTRSHMLFLVSKEWEVIKTVVPVERNLFVSLCNNSNEIVSSPDSGSSNKSNFGLCMNVFAMAALLA